MSLNLHFCVLNDTRSWDCFSLRFFLVNSGCIFFQHLIKKQKIVLWQSWWVINTLFECECCFNHKTIFLHRLHFNPVKSRRKETNQKDSNHYNHMKLTVKKKRSWCGSQNKMLDIQETICTYLQSGTLVNRLFEGWFWGFLTLFEETHSITHTFVSHLAFPSIVRNAHTYSAKLKCLRWQITATGFSACARHTWKQVFFSSANAKTTSWADTGRLNSEKTKAYCVLRQAEEVKTRWVQQANKSDEGEATSMIQKFKKGSQGNRENEGTPAKTDTDRDPQGRAA